MNRKSRSCSISCGKWASAIALIVIAACSCSKAYAVKWRSGESGSQGRHCLSTGERASPQAERVSEVACLTSYAER